MKQLREKGVSYSKIGERVFDKYGYTLDPRDIRSRLSAIPSREADVDLALKTG